MADGGTPERRKKQSEVIRRWHGSPVITPPGPRIAEGKAIASKNAYAGGFQPLMRSIAMSLRDQGQWKALKLAR